MSNITYKENPGGAQVTYWVEAIDLALQEAPKKPYSSKNWLWENRKKAQKIQSTFL